MAIKITVDGKVYNDIDTITVGGKVLTLIHVEDSAGGGDVPDTPDVPDVPIEPDEPHTHSYTSSVTKAATCETDGVRTYVCACGHSYTQTIPATGHNYVDGTCTNCGAADPDHEEIENNGWVDGQPYELNKTDCLSLDTNTGETVAANSGTMVTDYLPCKGVSAFTFEWFDSASLLNYALYDENKQFIASSGLIQGVNDPNADDAIGTTTLKNFYANPKSKGVAYVRFTQRSSLKCINSVTPHKYPTLRESTEYEAGRWYETDAVSGFVDATTGVPREDTSWYRTGYLLVYGASKISFAYYTRKTVVFYDSNKNYISGATVNNTFDFVIPENAVYMVASSIDMRDQMIWITQ